MQLTVLASTTEEAPRVVREIAVGQANEVAAALTTPSEGAQTVLGGLAEGGAAVERVKGAVDTWSPLLKQIGRFIEVTDKITDVSDLKHL